MATTLGGWRRVAAIAVGVGVLGGPIVASAEAEAETARTYHGPYETVSVDPSGNAAPMGSGYPTLSPDGNLVLFTSDASTLVPGDTNGVKDLFLRDRVAGTTERIDVSSEGHQDDGPPGPYVDERASMSADGRIVAFSSLGTNLVAGDTNGRSDVFVRDRVAGTTVRVSTTSAGAQVDARSWGPRLSADGRYLNFHSDGALVPADADGGATDVYRLDRETGALSLLTVNAVGSAGGGAQSSDGRWVVYGWGDRTFRYDAATGAEVEVVRGVGGATPDAGAAAAQISDDGATLAFSSYATNLTVDDPPGFDVYVSDLATGALRRLTSAVQGSGEAMDLALSRDGTTLAYHQLNRPLKVVDLATGDSTAVDLANGLGAPAIDGDGTTVAFLNGYSPNRRVVVADLDGAATAPAVTCDAADDAWHPDNVTVACTAVAPEGLVDPADAAFTLSTSVADGQAQWGASTPSRTVCATGGRCTTVRSTGHHIDRAAPQLVLSEAFGPSLAVGASFDPLYDCDDPGGGEIVTCEGTVDGVSVGPGAAHTFSDTGTHRVELVARDAAGNEDVVRLDVVVSSWTLRGRVVDSQGAPVAGAAVQLWRDGDLEPVLQRASQANGSFQFAVNQVAPGPYRVFVTADGFPAAWYGGEDQASATPLQLGTTAADIEVELGADVTPPDVQCTPPPGSSDAVHDRNVGLSCTASDDVALADPEDASFELLTQVADGEESADATTEVREVCDAAGNCTVAGPGGPFLVDRKAPGVALLYPSEGMIVGAGSDLGEAFAICDDLFLVTCATSPAGPLPNTPGTHTVTVIGVDEAGRTTVVERSYQVVGATFTGRVFDLPKERPIAGAVVTFFRADGPTLGEPVATATTDASGNWSATVSPFVPHHVRFQADGYGTSWYGGTATHEGSTLVGGPPGTWGPIYAWLRSADVTPPSSSCPVPPSSTGWRTAQVVVSCTVADPSGVVGPTQFSLSTSVPAGAESATAVTDSRQVCDQVGNCTTVGPIGTFQIDRQAPTTTCPAPPSSWSASERTVTCTVAEGGVGPASGSVNLSTNVGAGNWSASASTNSVTICDFLGNCATAQATGFKIDRAAPTMSCPLPPTTWAATNQQANCTASDPGAGPAGPIAVVASTAVNAGEENSAAAVRATLCDAIGNCASRSATGWKIDRKAPTVSCAAPSGAWLAANASLACTHADAGSGLPATWDPFPPFIVNQPYPTAFSATTNVAAGAESSNATATATQRCDVVGNCTPVSIAGNKVDRKVPVVTVAAPATGLTVREGTPVTASYTCADLSLVSCTGTVPSGAALPSTIGTHSLVVTGTDAVGQTTTVTRSYTVHEGVAPTVACLPPAPTTTWRSTQVTVPCTASDASGLQAPGDAAFELSTAVAVGEETADASTPSRTVCDVHGNCTTVGGFGGYRIDRAGPALACTTPSTGWNQLNVSLTCTPTDGGAGYVKAPTVKATTAVPNGSELGGLTLSVQACDVLGNCATRTVTDVKVDRKVPTVACDPADDGWHRQNVVLSCTQADGGSGLAPSSPRSGAGTFTVATTIAANRETTSATATADAPKACDRAGNCVGVSVTGIKIDRKAPTAACPPRDLAWHADNVVLTCIATDLGSGPVAPTFTSSTSVAPGAESAVAPTSKSEVCDEAGNCALLGAPGPYKIDRKAPLIALTGPREGDRFAQGRAATAAYSCVEKGSGLAQCAGPVAPGGALPTGALGTFPFTVVAVDGAGNVATATVSWSVEPVLSGQVLDDATGSPIEGAVVELFEPTGDGPAVASASTDALGRYAFDPTVVGSFKVAVSAPGTHAARWYGAKLRDKAKVVALEGPRPTIVDLRLVPTA